MGRPEGRLTPTLTWHCAHEKLDDMPRARALYGKAHAIFLAKERRFLDVYRKHAAEEHYYARQGGGSGSRCPSLRKERSGHCRKAPTPQRSILATLIIPFI